ncbi:hypothetical protein ALC60_08474, partial [Trachymyrmex zeteki]
VLLKQDILNALSRYDVFVNFNEQKLKHRNNSVWQNICNVLKNKIKLSTLNLYVEFNRNGVFDDLLLIKRNTQSCSRKINEELIDSNASAAVFNNASDDISMISFSFDIDTDDAINLSEFREEQIWHEQIHINAKGATVDSDT